MVKQGSLLVVQKAKIQNNGLFTKTNEEHIGLPKQADKQYEILTITENHKDTGRTLLENLYYRLVIRH